MLFKLARVLAAFSLLLPGPTEAGQRGRDTNRYTIQVASFSNPAQSKQLIARLTSLGERSTASVVDLGARGYWTRVLVGSFASGAEARAHAERLLQGGLIDDFLIRPENVTLEETAATKETVATGRGAARPADPIRSAGASRGYIAPTDRATTLNLAATGRAVASGTAATTAASGAAEPHPSATRGDLVATGNSPIPVARRAMFALLALTPSVDARLLPRPDPVRLAFMLIAGDPRPSVGPRGGLWVTGDAAEGLARLRWIAGENAAELVSLERDGRVKLDARLLAKASRLDEVPLVEGPLAVTRHICSNEGLLLLVQVTQTRHRYRLHIADNAPTHGAAVEVRGGLNLDNNFDSRINPHRRAGKKMDNERPPEGFDSLVAINPGARWLNQETNQVVPSGHIIFHEMAEAHAKLELGLDYLSDAARPGAHDVALQREQRLKSQRPGSGVVVTVGSNRVLRSDEEVRVLFARPSSQRP